MATSSKITIELWDSKLAPLSAEERSSVSWMQGLCETKPVPAKFSAAAASRHNTSRPNTPVQNNLLRKVNSRIDLSSAVSSPRQSSALGRPASMRPDGQEPQGPLSLQAPVETTQQFLDWFSHIEGEIEAEQERDYRRHLDTVDGYVDGCDHILDELEESRGLLFEMQANYKFVEENSQALQSACEDMLGEQKHLLQVTEAIGSRLEYFKELDRATRMLNLPGDAIVLEPDFLDLIDRLDICLDFLRNNRDFRDAEVYLIRFQQCLTRAMTLIKLYFTAQVNALTSSVSEKSTKSLNDMAVETLLYAKFSTMAGPIKPLVYELEKRAFSNPDEYASLLAECHATWFAARNTLLAERINQEVSSMEPYTANLVKLARSGCNYVRSVSLREWELFKDFFSISGKEEMYEYLESLCDKLSDHLRPRILHEPKLEILCELCTVLQALIALDDNEDADRADETAQNFSLGQLTPPRTAPGPYSPGIATSTPSRSVDQAQAFHRQLQSLTLGPLKFSRLLLGLLQDSQTRLVFRAQHIIHSEVLHYTPTDDDLDFPKKLKSDKRMSLWLAPGDDGEDNETATLRLPDQHIQETWYPTLRKTLWVLTRLHTYVNNAIFEDLAGEAVTMCRQSLVNASQRLAGRPESGALAPQLFCTRHLLILKEMIRTIDVVHVERGQDYFSIADALSGLLWSSSSLFNSTSSLYDMATRGIQSLTENMKDAKIELDHTLKVVCEELIVQAGGAITAPLRAYLTRSQAYLATKGSGGGPTAPVVDLTQQPWALPDQVRKLHDAFVGEQLEKGSQEVLGKMDTWLTDRQALSVLVPPIQEEVMTAYRQFYGLVRSEYDFEVSNEMTRPEEVHEKVQQLGGELSSGERNKGQL